MKRRCLANRTVRSLLLAAFAAAVALPALAQEATGLGEAEALLRQAEEDVVRGRYEQAVRTYRGIAERFPDTEAGRIAARRAQPSAYIGSRAIVEHGPAANRVDVALMGDGYELKYQKSFAKLAQDVPPLFERQATLREYYSYFNFHCVSLVSAANGVDGFGRDYDTALGAHTIGTIAGHVAIDPELVGQVFGQMPGHDSLAVVFVRNGVLGTGGGGIATIGGRDASTAIHEWGHAFAGLGDEYSTETHQRGGVRESANVSASGDPEKVPWAHFIAAKVPGVGVYEGASGQVRGAWKPTSGGCVMENGEFFCPPCRETLLLRIYSLVDPIDGCSPPPHELWSRDALELVDALAFDVRVMQPASHELEVRWWLVPERGAPREPRTSDPRYRGDEGSRMGRGTLAIIGGEPTARTSPDRDGVHSFSVKASDLQPGRYRLVCRARDAAVPGGESSPWVLKDEHGLLESERGWWVSVPATRAPR